MYCTQCGKEISDIAAVCVNCGAEVKKTEASTKDRGSAGWWWLGFLVPLAGLVFWAACQDSQPKNAKKAGIGALVGIIVSVALAVLFYIAYFVLVYFALTMA